MVGGNGKDYRLTKLGSNGFANLLKKVVDCKHLSNASTSRILKKKKKIRVPNSTHLQSHQKINFYH